MADLWIVVEFDSAEGVDKSTGGLTLREANELMDRLRDTGGFGAMQAERHAESDWQPSPPD